MLSAEIEINASPSVVRELFLDFPKLSSWHGLSFFQSIEVLTPGKTTGRELVKGDIMKVVIPSGAFKPVVMDNEPGHFSWLGSLPYIFTGQHDFFFAPHPSDPNRTLFKQQEEFSGLLSPLMSLFSAKTKAGWERFNDDIKKAAESAQESGRS